MKNEEIRFKCMVSGVRLYELGQKLGYKHAPNFSVALRQEFPTDLKIQALTIIDELAKAKEINIDD